MGNSIVKADMAEAARIIKKLQAKNIPVLWRPLHEASGGWFWWGAKGPEAAKKLWVMMFDYFKEQGINNLIWVWTIDIDPTKNKSDKAWHPGDNYVDIVGCDVYTQKKPTVLADRYNAAQMEYYTKMVTMSECGNTLEISNQWSAGAKWSYFMPWYDPKSTTESTGHEWATAAWWNDAFAQECVITRDEMPSLK